MQSTSGGCGFGCVESIGSFSAIDHSCRSSQYPGETKTSIVARVGRYLMWIEEEDKIGLVTLASSIASLQSIGLLNMVSFGPLPREDGGFFNNDSPPQNQIFK